MANRFSGLARPAALMVVLLSALGSLGWLWWNCTRRADVYFLPRLAPAEWIIYPCAPSATVNPRLEMSTVFRRSFTLERMPATMELVFGHAWKPVHRQIEDGRAVIQFKSRT